MRGRKSEKKTSLLRIYWNLRISMEAEEIVELMRTHPDFRDPEEKTTDQEIKESIVILSKVMDSVLILGEEEAISLEGYR